MGKSRLEGARLGMAVAALGLSALAAHAGAPSHAPTAEGTFAQTLQPTASFDNVPVGIAVSKDGRTFLSFSRAIDPNEPFSVMELKDGKAQTFPPRFKQDAGSPAADRLLSVQALTVDARNRLWILDCGRVGTTQPEPGSAKLVGYDLDDGTVVKTIPFPAEIAGGTSFLNDVRVDLGRGPEGVAYITDASPEGPNGIVVVDLASGKAVRRLNDHPATRPDPTLTLHAHGTPLVMNADGGAGQPLRIGADGIALSPGHRWVYFAPLTSHHLFRVDANVLSDPSRSDADVRKSLQDLGDRGFASDGLLEDAQGRIYATDFENGAIHRLTPDGTWELVVKSGRLHWPDSLALQGDGTLLFTDTQIDLSQRFHAHDQRVRPFQVFAVKTDSAPLFLGRMGSTLGRTGER